MESGQHPSSPALLLHPSVLQLLQLAEQQVIPDELGVPLKRWHDNPSIYVKIKFGNILPKYEIL